MSDWRWPVLAIVVALVTGFVGGTCWRDNRHQGWEAERTAVLAQRDSVVQVADAIGVRADSLRTVADSLGREARRLAQNAERSASTARAMRNRLEAVIDSVHAVGDSLVPVALLDTARAVIAYQDYTIGQQQQVITTLAADTTALAAFGRLQAAAAEHWKGRAEVLEQTLKGYRPASRPKLLGILPAPSPTVSLLVGAVVTAVVVH